MARCRPFRTRPLSGDYPYLMLDATFEKVPENSRVVLQLLDQRRQLEVLGEVRILVAEGETNPQIADRLSLSWRTVQKHLERVYEKLRVHTQTEAAMILQAR